MGTSNRDFRIKNGLIVDGASATVNGNNVLTSASSINDLGDVVITDPSTGQVIKWNGTAWINDTDATGAGGAGNSFTTIDVPNGTDPVADSATDTLTFSDGANITITGDSSTDTVTVAVDADLTGITSILTPNYIGLDLTPTGVPGTQGTLAWNPDQETLDIQLDTNVTLPVGQKHVIRVKNNSDSVAIAKGRVVMFAGATGDTVKVTPAISTATYEPYTLVGVTSEEIPADDFGFVTQYGFINGLDTNSWTLGDLLYVDPTSPGVLTNSAPAAPNWKFPIGAVTKVNSSSGRILVRAIPGEHLHDIIDVAITDPQNNQILAYDDATYVWKNIDIPDESVTLRHTIIDTGTQSVDLTGAPALVFAVVVGGGGGGGQGVTTTYFAGGGGGGGAVVSGWVPALTTCFVGEGGNGATSTTAAQNGVRSAYSGLYAEGGARGGRGQNSGDSSSFGAGASGAGDNLGAGTNAGGVGSALGYSVGGNGGTATCATVTGTAEGGSGGTSGGGGGAYVVITTASASATGGYGGSGMTGGGGGSATSNATNSTGQATGGNGGSGAGGAGGTATATTGTATGKQSSGGGGGGYLGAGSNGTAGTGTTARDGGNGGSGGGGGGAGTSGGDGGNGGDGCVLIYW